MDRRLSARRMKRYRELSDSIVEVRAELPIAPQDEAYKIRTLDAEDACAQSQRIRSVRVQGPC